MNQIAIMESMLEVLGKQVDDLKCCGNCKGTPDCDYVGEGIYTSAHYCNEWESDGLTRKDRE